MMGCLNYGGGQGYGYIVYEKEFDHLKTGDVLKIRGRIHDLLIVLVNGVMVNEPILKIFDLNKLGSWAATDAELVLDLSNVDIDPNQPIVLHLWVENLGRVNYGEPHVLNNQRKGIWEGPVLLNNETIKHWKMYSFEFKKDWTSR